MRLYGVPVLRKRLRRQEGLSSVKRDPIILCSNIILELKPGSTSTRLGVLPQKWLDIAIFSAFQDATNAKAAELVLNAVFKIK